MNEIHITSAREFEDFRQGIIGGEGSKTNIIYVYLDNDIDMNDLGSDNNLSTMKSENLRYYHFDGQNHTIYNIYSYHQNEDFVLLDGFLSMQNLMIKDVFCNNYAISLFSSFNHSFHSGQVGDENGRIIQINNVRAYGSLFGFNFSCMCYIRSGFGVSGQSDCYATISNCLFCGTISSYSNDSVSCMISIVSSIAATSNISDNFFKGNLFGFYVCFCYISSNSTRSNRNTLLKNNFFMINQATNWQASGTDFCYFLLLYLSGNNSFQYDTINITTNILICKKLVVNASSKTIYVIKYIHSSSYPPGLNGNNNCYDKDVFDEDEIELSSNSTATLNFFIPETTEHLKDPEYMGLNYNFPY